MRLQSDTRLARIPEFYTVTPNYCPRGANTLILQEDQDVQCVICEDCEKNWQYLVVIL